VTTSVSDVNQERRSHLRAIYSLVEDFIIPPVAARSGLAGPE
jgi:hypothetical protein